MGILQNFKSIFKAKAEKYSEIGATEKVTWASERYESILTQRNLFVLITIIALGGLSIAMLSAVKIMNSKEIMPFVIQVDESTGTTTIVNPLGSEILSGNDSLSRYFIKKYISARETYNAADFDTVALKFVKLTLTDNLYFSYYRYISNKETDPRKIYGATNSTYMKVKSWSKLENDKFICRFSIHETAGGLRVWNKIAIVKAKYVPMELDPEEQDMNPVGFQLTDYRVDEDES